MAKLEIYLTAGNCLMLWEMLVPQLSGSSGRQAALDLRWFFDSQHFYTAQCLQTLVSEENRQIFTCRLSYHHSEAEQVLFRYAALHNLLSI